MKKVNLGCGQDYKEGYINIDFHNHVKVEMVHNLNQIPYPFEDNSIDFIYASHILEHLNDPFTIMKELHRILKIDGKLQIKVPHFSRGFTHSEHKAGFDVTFPYYFNPTFTKSGYYGIAFELEKMELHYFAFFHLLPFLGVSKFTIFIMKIINKCINFFANLSPNLCSRLWCFWVGGFEEIEFNFTKK